MSKYCYNEACTKDFLNLENDVIFAKQAGFDLIELRFDCINKYLEKHTITDNRREKAKNQRKHFTAIQLSEL